ncbi:hypothetical protein LN042_22965 [Kitasatospora sp. RB6PN24]|uniref:hypothetical protein n=1 Tax=Kitasatospora humi TaxID=2893891 RepID=UPI001E6125A3|nr:hypothetical protein [Kitasatospora humi]MCC9309897.1 hypothetical protein [Kitasatospora humi]
MTEADFFQAGHTYIQTFPDSRLVRVFQCTQVAVHPVSGEPRAFGFSGASTPGQDWRPNCETVAYRPAHWDGEWVVVSGAPAPQSLAAPPSADVLARPAAEAIPDGCVVTYHGNIRMWRGVYRAYACKDNLCSRVYYDHDARYRLHALATNKPLKDCVPRSSITRGRQTRWL